MRMRHFCIGSMLVTAILSLSALTLSQTAESYLKVANTKVAAADKLEWGSAKWKETFRSALADLNEAIKLDPKTAAYFAKRAEVKEYLDDLASAEKDASVAISLAPDEPGHYALRGSLRQSIETIRVADAREKLDPESTTKIAADYRTSLDDFNKAVSLALKDPKWYVARGNFYELTERTEMALTDYAVALELDSRLVSALQKRGSLRSRNELFKEAIEDFTRLIEIDPKMTTAYLFRAEAFENLKQYEKAIADTTAALKTAPNSSGILQARADRYRLAGKIALAKKDELAAKQLRRSGN